MTAERAISTLNTRIWLEVAKQSGEDLDELLAAVGCTRAQAYDPDGQLPWSTHTKIRLEVARRSGDEHFFLHAAERVPFGAFRALDYLMKYAPTAGESIARIAGYVPMIDPTVRLPIRVEADGVHLGHELHDPLGADFPERAIFTFAMIVHRARQKSRRDWQPVVVRFALAARGEPQEYRRHFGCPVEFSAGSDEVVISLADWEIPAADPDPALFGILDEYAQQQLEQSTARPHFTRRVEQALLEELAGGGKPTLEEIAGKLGMSQRTMERRLRDESTAFREILNRSRQSLAKHYLADRQVAISEIANLLGFSSTSAFHRAFRRWTGRTPRAYRLEPTP